MKLKSGMVYVVEERVPLRTHELLRREMRKGKKALYISKHSPRQLNSQFEATKERLTARWLTPRPDDDCIPPMNLKRFEDSIVQFLKENEDGIIVLNGIDVLNMWNGFRPVLDVLRRTRNEIGESNMIISLDPKEHYSSHVGALERLSDEVVAT